MLLAIGAPPHAAARTTGLWWMPDVASKAGEQIDQLTYFIYYLTGAVFVLTQIVYIYFLIRYRAKKGVRANLRHGEQPLEIGLDCDTNGDIYRALGIQQPHVVGRHPHGISSGTMEDRGNRLPVRFFALNILERAGISDDRTSS